MKFILLYAVTSIEARLQRASMLRRMGNGAQVTALRRQWFGDSASSNALSMNLFAPMAYSVMMVLQAKASKGP